MYKFDKILKEALAGIGEQYFQLPLAGSDDLIYRERVYCYELYHQMRVRWPEDCQYSLCGEVDKAGHPLIRENGLDNLKPDFLVHVPRYMRGNYVVMEVKSASSYLNGICKDIETLQTFIAHANYERGIILIYGQEFDELPEQICLQLQRVSKEIDIWIHSRPSTPAKQVFGAV